MFAKLAGIGASAALLLAMAVPGFAHYWSDDDLIVDIHNWAHVTNNVTTKAYTGDNSIHGKWVTGGAIYTGVAGASSAVFNTVNLNAADPCACLGGLGSFDDVTLTIKNGAHVDNNLYTKAETGDNSIGGKYVGGGLIATGVAGATSYVENVVNTNVLGD